LRAWLSPFFEEVNGTYSENVGYLLERVGAAAAMMLEPPHRAWRKPGSLRKLALRKPLVYP
jgi:hypothetical protein